MSLKQTSKPPPKQPHILVVTSVYPLSSTTDRHGSFVHETVLHLRSQGIRFTVFAPAFQGLKHQRLEGVKVHRFRYCLKRFENLTHGEGAPTKIQNPFYILIAACYILAGTWQMFGLCRRDRPDLIHVHWPFPHGLMAFPSSKLLGIPMVFTFHGAELLLARKFAFVAKILQWLVPMARGVTANSSFTSKLIQHLYPTDVSIIPYGLTIEPKLPQQRPPDELPTLLYTGRLIERKGVKYLVQAFAQVLPQYPARLRIVGDGVLRSDLETLCRSLGISDSVDFLGFVPNEILADEYARCDVFVLPSIVDRKGDTEGLGIVMIEAMAHAKPVIASAVGGVVDVIQSGVTGLLVPEKDADALAAAILSLLQHPDRAAQLGHNGLVDVQTRFGWDHIVKLWEIVFCDALDRHSPVNKFSTALKEP